MEGAQRHLDPAQDGLSGPVIFVVRMLAVLAMGASPLAAQQDPLPKLTIDGAPSIVVRDRAALALALRPCARAESCASIMLETCDRCWIAAERTAKGFALHLRTGPPGPFYVAVRSDPAKTVAFTLDEAEAILASNLDDAPKADWYQWKEEDLFE